jgi:hypothetical protein
MVESTLIKDEYVKLKSNFLMRSRLPSINAFSVFLTFIGGRLEIKKFLSSLCKGGMDFYVSKV